MAELPVEGTRRGRISPALFPVAVFMFTALMGGVLWWTVEHYSRKQLELRTRVTAEQVRTRLESWFDQRVSILGHLADEWPSEFQGNPAGFERAATNLVERFPEFQAINWMDEDWVIRVVAPRAPNVEALGKDVHDHPNVDTHRSITRAMETHRVARTHADIEFYQGGNGFVAHWPVYDESGALKGFINGVFQLTTLIESCLAEPQLRENFRYALIEDDGYVIYQHGGDVTHASWPHAVELRFDMLDLPVRLVFAPSHAIVGASSFAVHDFIIVFALAAAVALGWLTRAVLQRQRALQRVEQRYLRVYEAANEAIFVIDPRDGVIRHVNSAAERLLGYPRDTLRGMAIAQLHPHDIQSAIAYLDLILQERKGQTDKLPFTTKDGRTIPVEISSSIIQWAGRNHILSMARDISARIEAEQALTRSEQKYRELVDLLPLIVFECTVEGEITFVNQYGETALGRTLDEIRRNCSVSELVAPHDRERAQEVLQKRLLGEEPGTHEYDILRRDGSTFPAIVETRAIVEGGTIVGFRGISLDVSERKEVERKRKELEEQIQQAQKLESLGVLAGGIAHDFNNLLMGVLGNADLTLMQLPEDLPQREYVEDIIKASQRASALCNQMLAYSGRGQFVIQPVSISEVVEDLHHLLESSISKKSHLRFEYGSKVPSLEADLTQLRQIVMNLVTNASDAIGDDDGEIVVRTGSRWCDEEFLKNTYLDDDLSEGEYVYLEVQDSGIGMDASVQAKVFEPFYTSKERGRGLGLSAVLGIVRGHRGALQVESTPGLGTRFLIYFPASELSSKSLGEDSDWPVHEVRSSPTTVLIVEDEALVLELAQRTLEYAGYQVLTARDGREGLEKFRAEAAEIDAVLLDLMMPHMNGDEVYREIARAAPETPVILSSGYTELEFSDRFSDANGPVFIQKPYRARDLLAVIERVLPAGASSTRSDRRP